MWHLLILTAVPLLHVAFATPTEDFVGPELRVGLLCGNYSLDVNQTKYIKSKRFAQDYPKDYTCDYSFYCSDYAAAIVFNCNTFVLQASTDCKKDFMKIDDGNAYNGVKYCGTNGPQNIATGANFIKIKFVSNNDNNRQKGFFCSVKCLHADDLTTTTTTTTTTTSSATTSTTTQSTTTTTTEPIITPSKYLGCRCGIPLRPSRIVNGNEILPGEYPWTSGIVTDRLMIPVCGATILNSKFAITAAHCVHNRQIEVLLGEHDWSKVSPVLKRKPARIFIHPNFNSQTLVNDLAIIEFDRSINLDSPLPIKPLCLPNVDTEFVNTTGIVVGWGKLSQNGLMSTSLQEAELPIISPSECTSPDPEILCAGDPLMSKDRCYGDDGGPLMVEIDGRHVLAGIITRKRNCAQPGDPAWFVKVQRHLTWIENRISTGKICAADMPSTTSTTTSSPPSTESTTTPAPIQGLQCACGIPINPLRIAQPSNIRNHPWTVALISKQSGTHFCSGVIINTYFVLTAASCQASSMNDIQVRSNAQDLSSNTASRYINRDVVNIISNSDLQILQLSNPLSLTNWDGILPACLPQSGVVFPSPHGVHSGYGRPSPFSPPSSVIRMNDGNFINCSQFGSSRTCYQPMQNPGFCGPDVGGPIVSQGSDGRAYLRGVAFHDQGCGQVNQEVVKVGDYTQWITDNTQTGKFCVL